MQYKLLRAVGTLAATGALAFGGVSAASAAPASPGAAISSGTSVTPLSAADCKRALSHAGGGDQCAVVLEVGPEHTGPAPKDAPLTAKAAAGWHYKTYKAHICAYDSAHSGGQSGWRCWIAGYTLQGQVAYNGKNVWGQWVTGSSHASKGWNISGEQHGFWNNGASGGNFMDLWGNAKFEDPVGNETFWLRIDVWPNGNARVRGGGAS